jgi:hypothetical protein
MEYSSQRRRSCHANWPRPRTYDRRPVTLSPRALFGDGAAFDVSVIADVVDWIDERNLRHTADDLLGW